MKANVWLAGLMCVGLVSTGMAQGFKIGGHGAYTTGGDVEDPSIGFGIQAELGISPHFALELAGTMFSDEASEEDIALELDMISIAASAKLILPLDDTISLYALGGVNYNIADASLDLGEWSWLGIEYDVDDGVGFHYGGGITLRLGDNLELMAEYRYTVYELEYTVNAPAFGIADESDKADYNFGLVKVGLNLLF